MTRDCLQVRIVKFLFLGSSSKPLVDQERVLRYRSHFESCILSCNTSHLSLLCLRMHQVFRESPSCRAPESRSKKSKKVVRIRIQEARKQKSCLLHARSFKRHITSFSSLLFLFPSSLLLVSSTQGSSFRSTSPTMAFA
jgi:hypothetical protein